MRTRTTGFASTGTRSFVGVIDDHNIAFSLISPDATYCKVVSPTDILFPPCIEQLVRLAETIN
jgi:hypothetical protein